LKKLSPAKMASIVFAFCTATAIASTAQTFTSLASLDGTDGSAPRGGLTQGTNGNFYGTATFGPNLLIDGTVFEVTPAGIITNVHAFSCTNTNCSNGGGPMDGVFLGANGNFYGLTDIGGANGFGTAFEITSAGRLNTIWSFCVLQYCADGLYPTSLMQANGKLYGTTSGGGAYEQGTIFELVPGGKLTTFYSFCSSINSGSCTDGQNPQAGLIEASNGNFYGTTYEGGANADGGGTIFEITPAGTQTTLYSFCAKANCADGASPNRLIEAAGGKFYGVTFSGGVGFCNGAAGCGTIYKMTPAGKLTTIYSFCEKSGCPDGSGPSPLIQASDGNFYGTTMGGGANQQGTIFELTPDGKLTTLYNFCSQAGCTDGEEPEGGLLQATNGSFYGTTIAGGINDSCDYGCGSAFSISAGLSPFVATVPKAGKVGTHVIIMGNNLAGTTSVSFNGNAATFAVVSDTEITATVPADATTGTVQVVTPGGTLASNFTFRVMP
jgi:uncharacterized repeat protein (TIGR03803 family)